MSICNFCEWACFKRKWARLLPPHSLCCRQLKFGTHIKMYKQLSFNRKFTVCLARHHFNHFHVSILWMLVPNYLLNQRSLCFYFISRLVSSIFINQTFDFPSIVDVAMTPTSLSHHKTRILRTPTYIWPSKTGSNAWNF